MLTLFIYLDAARSRSIRRTVVHGTQKRAADPTNTWAELYASFAQLATRGCAPIMVLRRPIG